jgi:hypothetical protein
MFVNQSYEAKHSISGTCLQRLCSFDSSLSNYSKVIRYPLKPFAMSLKLITYVALSLIALAEGFLRIGLSVASLPMLFISYLPIFDEKLSHKAADITCVYLFFSGLKTLIAPVKARCIARNLQYITSIVY